ncbi:MAG: S8 family serine peptidase [Lachnospiraceae bacterium]|nr:S8 family serine peptidase [Lachnospiraceae bacterium]
MTGEERADSYLEMAWRVQEEGIPLQGGLAVGYEQADSIWTVLVRTAGDLENWRRRGLEITELYGGYGVLRLPVSEEEWVLAQPQLVYMEKPHRMNPGTEVRPLQDCAYQGRRASCLAGVQEGADALTGAGVLVAILDTGIDVEHLDFQREDGSSRILWYWDQEGEGVPPEGFGRGAEYTAADIEAGAVPGIRNGQGHGTGVLGVAAGNGRASGGRDRGVAYGSDILAVNLATAEEGGFPRTTELMEAAEYVLRRAEQLNRPVAVNISLGNNYGSHEGDTLLEMYLSERQSAWKSVFVIGSGNEGESEGHAGGSFAPFAAGTDSMQEVELAVAEGEKSLSVQLWKSAADDLAVELTAPDGRTLGRLERAGEYHSWQWGETRVLAYAGGAAPYRLSQDFLWEWLPTGKDGTITPGIWRFRLLPRRIVQGRYDLYLPGSEVRGTATRFLRPEPDTTLTIPSAAAAPVAVGAWNPALRQPTSFSGRGYTRLTERVKPFRPARGVDITAAAPGGGYRSWTGTSFAAPFVTGAAALLMEWGIIRGNDPFCYGENLKARLIRGAASLPGHTVPNRQIGWGTLCLEASLR